MSNQDGYDVYREEREASHLLGIAMGRREGLLSAGEIATRAFALVPQQQGMGIMRFLDMLMEEQTLSRQQCDDALAAWRKAMDAVRGMAAPKVEGGAA